MQVEVLDHFMKHCKYNYTKKLHKDVYNCSLFVQVEVLDHFMNKHCKYKLYKKASQS